MNRRLGLGRVLAGRTRKAIIGIAMLALVAIPVANVFASHIFSDVPDSSGYADAIHAIANAGITYGCTTDKFCPKGLVTREQMAVFLNRLGNLNDEQGPVVDALSVAGETVQHLTENFTLSGTLGKTECRTSSYDLPPFTELPYVVTTALYDGPAITSEINVSADDPDPEDGAFDVCFTSVDTSLQTGDYKTVSTVTYFLGSGIFASEAKAASVSRYLGTRR